MIFDFQGEFCRCIRTMYENNHANAVIIENIHGEPMAALSCNLPHCSLDEDEFLAKTWSENEPIAAACKHLFIDTGKRISTGYVEAEVWKFRPATITLLQ